MGTRTTSVANAVDLEALAKVDQYDEPAVVEHGGGPCESEEPEGVGGDATEGELKGPGVAHLPLFRSSDDVVHEDLAFVAAAAVTTVACDTEVHCPAAHPVLPLVAGVEYQCDRCAVDILIDRQVHYCQACDYSICVECHGGAVAAVEDARRAGFAGPLLSRWSDIVDEWMVRGPDGRLCCCLGRTCTSACCTLAHPPD